MKSFFAFVYAGTEASPEPGSRHPTGSEVDVQTPCNSLKVRAMR